MPDWSVAAFCLGFYSSPGPTPERLLKMRWRRRRSLPPLHLDPRRPTLEPPHWTSTSSSSRVLQVRLSAMDSVLLCFIQQLVASPTTTFPWFLSGQNYLWCYTKQLASEFSRWYVTLLRSCSKLQWLLWTVESTLYNTAHLKGGPLSTLRLNFDWPLECVRTPAQPFRCTARPCTFDNSWLFFKCT